MLQLVEQKQCVSIVRHSFSLKVACVLFWQVRPRDRIRRHPGSDGLSNIDCRHLCHTTFGKPLRSFANLVQRDFHVLRKPGNEITRGSGVIE